MAEAEKKPVPPTVNQSPSVEQPLQKAQSDDGGGGGATEVRQRINFGTHYRYIIRPL